MNDFDFGERNITDERVRDVPTDVSRAAFIKLCQFVRNPIDQRLVDVYQTRPNTLEGIVAVWDQRTRFHMDLDSEKVVFQNREIASHLSAAQLRSLQDFTKEQCFRYYEECENTVRDARTSEEIAALYRISEDDDLAMSRAYRDFTQTYMHELYLRNPTRDRENVSLLEQADSLVQRGLDNHDDRDVHAGIAIVSDVLSNMYHANIRLSDSSSETVHHLAEAVRPYCIRDVVEEDLRMIRSSLVAVLRRDGVVASKKKTRERGQEIER